MRLPFADAIWRFRDNDERVDIFVNGDETESYVTEDNVVVPSIRKIVNDLAVASGATAYVVIIESSIGTIFRVGQGQTTTLSARVFENGIEITSTMPAERFKWRRVSATPQPYPNDDATWNAVFASGYKSISVDVDEVFARATYFCEITS